MKKIKLYFANLENKLKIAILKKLGWEPGIGGFQILNITMLIKEGETLIVPKMEADHYKVKDTPTGYLAHTVEFGYKESKIRTVEVANHTVQEAWLKEINKLKFWKK